MAPSPKATDQINWAKVLTLAERQFHDGAAYLALLTACADGNRDSLSLIKINTLTADQPQAAAERG